MGSDKDGRPLCCRQSYFNSRSLRGERYVIRQSNNDIIVISILAPSVGSARNVLPDARDESDFNSRSLLGERLR